ncbi:deuterosome assembly protein 1 isoform X4 [Microcaecilia unicolor]|uniref:Deuterosome assembly protein 1 n=1 Tax=Microcaecilia unicolor TaxID=1415580 RepID=A0A6P7XU55_9AMPH|nr:deuterosome assembly protein 1 isoform X4 [Microcaecilia unicolor]
MTQQLEFFPNPILTRTFSCETELEELMHQIDIMVNNKKLEWERQVQVLETRLDIREKELINARNAMDQKIREMEILHQKKEDDVEKSRCEIAQNYEGQLQTLKYQLSKLQHSYEKLQLHHKKKVRSYRTELSPEHERTQSELNRLNQKLEEFKTKSKEWEKQRILYQHQLGTLDRQRKSLAEKCKLFQKQSQNHHTWLTGRRLLQDSTFTSLSEIRHLREQLHVSQKNIMSSEGIIRKLKSDMNEAAMNNKKLQEEKQRLLQELKKCHRQCQNLELELSEVKTELQSRDDLLRAVEMEQIQMHKELAKNRSIEENVKSFESSHTQSIKLNEELKKKMEFHISELRKGVKSLREQKSCTTTLEKLQYENERLQNDVIKVQSKLELSSETGCEKPEESLSYSGHDVREKMFQQENNCELKTELLQSSRHYINSHSPHNETDDIAINSSWDSPSANIFRNPEGAAGGVIEVPIVDCLHNQGISNLSFLSQYIPGDSIVLSYPEISCTTTAAEKFLQEEEKRAKEFEKILNSHIDELEKNSKKILCKSTHFNQIKNM